MASYDIEITTEDTLELDTIIKNDSNATDPINKVETSSSYNLTGFQTKTAVFDPEESGEYDIHINGQILSVNVTDANAIPDSVLAEDLVAWYQFDDGDLRDYTAIYDVAFADSTPYDGFNSNNITFEQSFAQDGTTACKINNNSENDNARFFIDKDVLYNRGSFTASLWVYESLSSQNRIINFGNNSANKGGMILGTKDSYPPKTRIYTDNGGGSWEDLNVNNLSYNNWHMITQVYDGSTNKAYVDGKLLSTDTRGYNDTPSNAEISIGNRLDSTSEGFGGYINDLRFYNTGLTDNQISEIYKNTKP